MNVFFLNKIDIYIYVNTVLIVFTDQYLQNFLLEGIFKTNGIKL